MPRPEQQRPQQGPLHARAGTTAVLGLVLLGSSIASAQEIPEALGDNWYRTEILVFMREDQESRRSQQFDPLPSLAYPSRYRYFIDPEVADRRLAESQAFASRIDASGQQYLDVPAAIEEILDHNRPDALLTEVPPSAQSAASGVATAAAAADPNAVIADDDLITELLPLDANEPLPDPNAPVLALPYEFLAPQQLSFGDEARSLRRQGKRVLFHETWWSRLAEGDEPEWLLLDRSGDPDTLDWPSLQGALRVYRSRYLHAEVDIWLNTLGDYLPEGWQIPAPPLAMPSVHSRTLAGDAVNPWAPEPLRPPLIGTSPVALFDMSDPDDPNAIPRKVTAAGEDESAEVTVEYPWRHAIVHQQSRRMRSGEIHYLDHPVIGVIVRVTPASAEDLPLLNADALEFRQRHALPTAQIPLEPPADARP